ncbi:MAG TPA: ATP-dependent acyl-CoA ligase [Pyrinomonadaceae bacterium]|nr:ATP-dependent acyl-CoA ligase [Pyrinomonadaceae bacterium]
MASQLAQVEDPALEPGVRDRLLSRLLEDRATQYGDRQFLNFANERSISYRELNETANRFANGLLALGLGKGKKIAVMLPNCPEYLFILFGAARIGAVTVPINTAYKGALLEHLLSNSDAELLVIDEQYLNSLAEIGNSLRQLKTVLLYPEQGINERQFPGNWQTLNLDVLHESSKEKPQSDIRHTDTVMILYTGGTTGPSKGVVMSNHFYYFYAYLVSTSIGYTVNDVSYTCMPLFHINAQIGSIVSALYAGAQVALYKRFSASTFWEEIRSSKATVFLGMGAVGNILAKGAPHSGDSNNQVRLAVIVPPPEDLEGFERRFGFRVVYETFGMTEGLIIPPKLCEPRRRGCCGKPIKDYEVRIVDDDDLPLPPGEVGELVFRPSQPYTMMSGYYKMPEATLEAFRNLWFHTGDLGYLDREGFLYYAGRKKDAIRRRGENISAYEIESVVNQHAKVLESAAIAVPSELGEDDVKIVVVLNPGAELTETELLRFCESRMAYFMVPRYVEFRDALPKNPSQRIEKYKLRAENITEKTWDRVQHGLELKR